MRSRAQKIFQKFRVRIFYESSQFALWKNYLEKYELKKIFIKRGCVYKAIYMKKIWFLSMWKIVPNSLILVYPSEDKSRYGFWLNLREFWHFLTFHLDLYDDPALGWRDLQPFVKFSVRKVEDSGQVLNGTGHFKTVQGHEKLLTWSKTVICVPDRPQNWPVYTFMFRNHVRTFMINSWFYDKLWIIERALFLPWGQ